MKIVLNKGYGDFSIAKEYHEILGITCAVDSWHFDRRNPVLIKLVEELVDDEHDFISGEGAKLCVVEIPDDTTDWDIINYDGDEKLVYVLNGKLHYGYPK